MPDDRAVARDWLEKADHDLVAAQELARLDERAPLDVICFHAQQCVEKCLKAILVLRSEEVPRTHDVVVLARRVPEMAEEVADVRTLNRYAVQTRYPGDSELISASDAASAVALAQRVRTRAGALIEGPAPPTRGGAGR